MSDDDVDGERDAGMGDLRYEENTLTLDDSGSDVGSSDGGGELEDGEVEDSRRMKGRQRRGGGRCEACQGRSMSATRRRTQWRVTRERAMEATSWTR